jgi:hypothetical protein
VLVGFFAVAEGFGVGTELGIEGSGLAVALAVAESATDAVWRDVGWPELVAGIERGTDAEIGRVGEPIAVPELEPACAGWATTRPMASKMPMARTTKIAASARWFGATPAGFSTQVALV